MINVDTVVVSVKGHSWEEIHTLLPQDGEQQPYEPMDFALYADEGTCVFMMQLRYCGLHAPLPASEWLKGRLSALPGYEEGCVTVIDDKRGWGIPPGATTDQIVALEGLWACGRAAQLLIEQGSDQAVDLYTMYKSEFEDAWNQIWSNV